MNEELIEYYYLLGLRPGASAADLKAAHRDLAKVWHPDRFLHDPSLQQKAQEKLKEINEAYDQLRSGKAGRRTPPAPTGARTAQANSQKVNVGLTQKIRWQLILASVLIFAAVFLVTSSSLLGPGESEFQSQIPAIEQADDPVGSAAERQPSGSRGNNSAEELPQGKDRVDPNSQREESGGTATSHPNAAILRPLPTVTIVIDPSTGKIARAGCPMKTRMTYPSGNEPHEYCTSHRAAPIPPVEVLSPSESRLKSVAKRLASPGKWVGGKRKPDGGTKPDPKSP